MLKRISLILLFLGTAWAFGQAGSALAQDPSEASRKPDPRMSNRFSLTATGVTVQELMRQASEASGVTMAPSAQDRYWQVREMLVSVAVKDVSVAEFQNQMEKLLDYSWSRTGSEPRWTYVMWQTAGASDREIAARTAVEREHQNKLQQGWQSNADLLSEALSGGKPEGIDPEVLAYVQNDPMGRPLAELLTALAPQIIPTLGSAEPFEMNFSRLAPAQQQNVQNFTSAMGELFWQMSGREGPAEAPEVNWNQVVVSVGQMPGEALHMAGADMGFLGMIQVRGEGLRMPFMFPLMDPTSEVARLMANSFNRMRAGEKPETVMQQVGEQFMAAMQKPREQPEVVAEELDPRLLKEVEIEAKQPKDPGAAAAELAEKAGLDIYSEAWKRPMMPATFDGKQSGTVKELLDRIGAAFSAEWEFDDGAVRFKAQQWPQMRAAMVPQEDIAYWKDYIKKHGQLSMQDLVDMVKLYSEEQVMTLMQEEGLSNQMVTLFMPESRAGIEFYALLGQAGQSTASGENGLPLHALSRAQSEKLASALKARGVQAQDVFVPGAALRLVESPNRTLIRIEYPPEKHLDMVLRRGPDGPPGDGPAGEVEGQPQPEGAELRSSPNPN